LVSQQSLPSGTRSGLIMNGSDRACSCRHPGYRLRTNEQGGFDAVTIRSSAEPGPVNHGECLFPINSNPTEQAPVRLDPCWHMRAAARAAGCLRKVFDGQPEDPRTSVNRVFPIVEQR